MYLVLNVICFVVSEFLYKVITLPDVLNILSSQVSTLTLLAFKLSKYTCVIFAVAKETGASVKNLEAGNEPEKMPRYRAVPAVILMLLK